MTENKLTNTKIGKPQKNQEISKFLPGVQLKDISWTPFIVMGIILSISIAAVINITTGFSSTYIIGAIIGLVVALLVLQKPELGAYILIISVFTNISDILTNKGLPSINRPLIALTVGSVIANYALRTGKFSKFPSISKSEWALLGFYTAIIISILAVPDKSTAASVIIDITKDILVGITLFITLNTPERLERGLWIFVITMTLLALLGVIKTITGTDQTFFNLASLSVYGQIGEGGELRYAGPLGESNLWGQVLVSTIPVVMLRFNQTKQIAAKGLLAISTFLLLLAMLYTSSRGAIVALAVIMPLIVIELRIKPIPILMGFLLFIVLLYVLPTTYTSRIITLDAFFPSSSNQTIAPDESIAARRIAMLTGIAMFKDNPLFGVGFGNYSNRYWEYAGRLGLESDATNLDTKNSTRYAHSLYVEIMSETGLFGILTFGIFFYILFSGLWRVRKKFQSFALYTDWTSWITALGISLLTFLISGIFLHGIFYRFIWMFIGFALAGISISDQTDVPRFLSKTA